jgi:hypothetical protein
LEKALNENSSGKPLQNQSLDEINKILDLIEKYGENWDEIGKSYPSTKKKEELIYFFLSLPLYNIASIHLFES